MDNVIIRLMNSYGYFGVFFLILVENLFPPIPSEVILAFGGFMTVKGKLNIIGVIIAATLGSTIGAVILYYLGYIFKTDKLIKFTKTKWGKILGLKEDHILKEDKWFDDKGNISVLICRCIPVVRSLISIPAGMSEMPLIKFLIYTVIGSTFWNTIVTVLGRRAGNNWEDIVKIFDKFSHVILIILIILFTIFLIYYFTKTFKKKKKNI